MAHLVITRVIVAKVIHLGRSMIDLVFGPPFLWFWFNRTWDMQSDGNSLSLHSLLPPPLFSIVLLQFPSPPVTPLPLGNQRS